MGVSVQITLSFRASERTNLKGIAEKGWSVKKMKSTGEVM